MTDDDLARLQKIIEVTLNDISDLEGKLRIARRELRMYERERDDYIYQEIRNTLSRLEKEIPEEIKRSETLLRKLRWKETQS